jgi:hypothetical protein
MVPRCRMIETIMRQHEALAGDPQAFNELDLPREKTDANGSAQHTVASFVPSTQIE